jgi:hypothetical protein
VTVPVPISEDGNAQPPVVQPCPPFVAPTNPPDANTIAPPVPCIGEDGAVRPSPAVVNPPARDEDISK